MGEPKLTSGRFFGIQIRWFPAGLILDLEALLRWRVDVITERGLNPLLRDEVLREAQPV